jgi:ABC-type lipoprotein export system ATPase subunit
MLEVNQISYSYDGSETLSFPSFSCKQGEQLLILGPSGSGKTTLLHLLAGLLQPKQGEIKLNGTNINELASWKLDKFRGRNIGIVFQRSHFLGSLTVKKNLLMAQKLAHVKANKAHLQSLLERLNVAHKINAKPHRLSIGEQQRISIARALLNSPSLIVADEPTSALDDNNCEEVITLLEQQAKEHKAALVIVTHDNRLKERFSNIIEL